MELPLPHWLLSYGTEIRILAFSWLRDRGVTQAGMWIVSNKVTEAGRVGHCVQSIQAGANKFSNQGKKKKKRKTKKDLSAISLKKEKLMSKFQDENISQF